MDEIDSTGNCVAFFSTLVTAHRVTSALVIEGPSNDSPHTFTTWISETDAMLLKSGTKVMEPIIFYWQETDLANFDEDYASVLAVRLEIDFTPTADGIVMSTMGSPTSGVTDTTPSVN
jgi:hypothetical protein